MKKSWKDRKGVSPVIATILMVAITVVLAAVLYVMVMGFGGEDSQTPNVSLGSRAVSAANTYEVYVISVSGGNVAIDNIEAVVVSGPAAAGDIASVPAARENQNLQAGDKTTVTASGSGPVTVMFRDIASGKSLGQVTFNVVGPAADP